VQLIQKMLQAPKKIFSVGTNKQGNHYSHQNNLANGEKGLMNEDKTLT